MHFHRTHNTKYCLLRFLFREHIPEENREQASEYEKGKDEEDEIVYYYSSVHGARLRFYKTAKAKVIRVYRKSVYTFMQGLRP